MERLRKFQATIAAASDKLTTSQKLLIGSSLILMVMTLMLVHLYTGKPDYVELLPGKDASSQADAVAYLQANGIDHTQGPAGVFVPASRRTAILAQLSQNGSLGGDNQILFNNLIDRQSWTMSQEQNKQLETIAVQNELATILSQWSGIRSANVILNLPQKRGLAQPRTSSSASVTVFPSAPINPQTVDAIASFVASARGIDIGNVRVIDGSSNRQHKAREEGAITASTHVELVTTIEELHRDKLMDMLTYIPGVIVTVRAQVDSTSRQINDQRFHSEGAGSENFVSREESQELSDSQASRGGEPGARSNVGESITGTALGGGASSQQNSSVTEFQPMPGMQSEQIIDPRGHATKINAVVNIPRSYFVEYWKSLQGADAEGADPTEDDLRPIVESETTRIRDELQPIIDTSTNEGGEQGEVRVSMIPIMAAVLSVPGGADAASALGFSASGGEMVMNGMVKTIALGSLAVVALGLVVFTALRSTRTEELPTAAELVGLPPALDNTSDLIGEADEADSVLQGVELSDSEMMQRKMMDQVNEMVDEQPDDAGKLLSRWVAGI